MIVSDRIEMRKKAHALVGAIGYASDIKDMMEEERAKGYKIIRPIVPREMGRNIIHQLRKEGIKARVYRDETGRNGPAEKTDQVILEVETAWDGRR